MTYAAMIRDLKKRGMTQAEIADAIDRSQSVVSQIATGKSTEIRASTAMRIVALHKRRMKKH